jgi:penicillin-insensitive murein endopeptidase
MRISCPPGNSACVSQKPADNTDGCDKTLDWWFTDEAKQSAADQKEKEPKAIKLPEQCDRVFKQ